ncbi:MAG TPA: clostripain-related cysteine peptidase, partial [Thermoleophilia bacterium]|nr:clostripain-related cysteine peptidase [Thermoleophilia bacterium]
IDTELSNPGSNANVNVVCIADRGTKKDNADGGWTDTKVFYCTKGMMATPANAVADWGERDMGSPQTLIDFMNWARTSYPADHYALVFWDHSYCWYPDYYDIRDDTSSGDALNPDEQTAAMRTVGAVDVVAWDACQQAMAEIASDWQPFARAMCASEDTVNWDGLRYTSVVTDLQADPAMAAQRVADDFAATARGDGLTYSSTALDGRFDALVSAIDAWSVALKNGLAANRSAYTSAWTATQGFADPGEKDLYDAAAQVKARVTDTTIRAACDGVMNAVVADTPVDWTNGNRKEANAHGIAIWWPKTSLDFPYNPVTDNDFAYYQTNIALASRTHWDEFLSAWTAQ